MVKFEKETHIFNLKYTKHKQKIITKIIKSI